MKKYNFVYKTTNLVNGKIYIGVHSTTNLNDRYLGSGNRLALAFEKYGMENFSRDILEFFDTREECYKREAELVNTDFILRSDTYNITEGGYGVRTHSPEGLQKLSEYAKNKAVMKDANGKFIKVDRTSEFFTNDLSGTTAGMVCAKDLNGKELLVSKAEFDSRDDLVGRTKDKMVVTEILTGETIVIDTIDYDKVKHQRFTTGKVTVKDKEGNTLQVAKDDIRYLSGELVGVMKGITYKQKNKEVPIKCPHCETISNAGNIKRWHFDKCKFKEKTTNILF